MSGNERRMKLGLLQERRDQLKALEHRAHGILGSLRDATFVVDSPFDLHGERIEAYAKEMREVIQAGNELRTKIDELKDELGAD